MTKKKIIEKKLKIKLIAAPIIIAILLILFLILNFILHDPLRDNGALYGFLNLENLIIIFSSLLALFSLTFLIVITFNMWKLLLIIGQTLVVAGILFLAPIIISFIVFKKTNVIQTHESDVVNDVWNSIMTSSFINIFIMFIFIIFGFIIIGIAIYKNGIDNTK